MTVKVVFLILTNEVSLWYFFIIHKDLWLILCPHNNMLHFLNLRLFKFRKLHIWNVSGFKIMNNSISNYSNPSFTPPTISCYFKLCSEYEVVLQLQF